MANGESVDHAYRDDGNAAVPAENVNVATEADIAETAAAEVPRAEPEVDDVIARLDMETGGLPEEAIRDARRLGPKIIPRFIELLRQAAEDIRNGKEVTSNVPFFALYLLAEFQAKEALPAIMEAAAISQERDADLFGDAITADLSRIFAVLAVDTPEVVDRLIADRAVDMYVRWEAASTYLYWVRDGIMTREAAVARLRQQLISAIQDADVEFITPLIICLTSFSPVEAEQEIKDAIERGLVDTMFVSQAYVERILSEGQTYFEEQLAYCRPSGISDTIEHLSSWASFLAEEPSSASHKIEPSEPSAVESHDEPESLAWRSCTIRRNEPHVGRNDPCPCGSGNKYKKCCGRNQ